MELAFFRGFFGPAILILVRLGPKLNGTFPEPLPTLLKINDDSC